MPAEGVDTLMICSYIRRLGPFLGFKLNFIIFGAFQKNGGGGIKKVRINFGVNFNTF